MPCDFGPCSECALGATVGRKTGARDEPERRDRTTRDTTFSSGRCNGAPHADRRLSFRLSTTARCISSATSVRGAGTTSWVRSGAWIRTCARTAITTNDAPRCTPPTAGWRHALGDECARLVALFGGGPAMSVPQPTMRRPVTAPGRMRTQNSRGPGFHGPTSSLAMSRASPGVSISSGRPITSTLQPPT